MNLERSLGHGAEGVQRWAVETLLRQIEVLIAQGKSAPEAGRHAGNRTSNAGASMRLMHTRVLATFVAVIGACGSAAHAETINSFRVAHGLPTLHYSRALHVMAKRHADSMAARHSMDHEGFFTERGPRGARAENVAWGCATASCAIRVWEASAGHRANMLLPASALMDWHRPRVADGAIGA